MVATEIKCLMGGGGATKEKALNPFPMESLSDPRIEYVTTLVRIATVSTC